MTVEEMTPDSRVYVAGHRGLVGQALVRRLRAEGFANIITAARTELDLTDQAATDAFFAAKKPEYVFCAAAKVGGIMANKTYPVDFLHENLLIQTSLLRAAHRHGARKTLLLGSSCIYPRLAPQPIREESLLTGPLESTNQWYAIAKIAGILLGQAYREQYGMNVISVMPTNLYGPGDNFDLETSHVLPALIRKFHEAKNSGAGRVTLWGSGEPLREFLHVDDLAEACLFLMRRYDSGEVINIGTGKDITIKGLAELIAETVGYSGEIVWDTSKPDGTPRKLLDISRIAALGWQPRISLRDGVAATYRWFVNTLDLGKEKMSEMDIPISKPSIGSREIAYVTDAVTSGWVSSLGGYITKFEQNFAKFCGVKHAVATSNGTVALHLALVAMGIGTGDEILVPDLTFVATANTVVHAGATPVFVDVDPVNFCIDPGALLKAITPRTKGIIPVHLYGYPANMPEIMRIAAEHDLFVLEDAAEAHGARIAGKMVGSWGDASAFSFYGNKIITTGEGGCVTTNSSELFGKLLYLRDHAMSREHRYWHTEIGYNYRMTNLQAALGVAQLERIDDFIAERAEILSWYRRYLKPFSGFTLNPVGTDAEPVCWMVCLFNADWGGGGARDAFMFALKHQGIDSRPFFHPISDFPMYPEAVTPNAHRVARCGVNLPCFIGLAEDTVKRICNVIATI